MGQRKRKYLIFMFGGWETVEASGNIIKNIREVMQTIVNGEELTFVTGNNIVIMCINSTMGFDEVEKITHEFLTEKVDSFFLMPKPRKLSYRLDYNLENHLFGDGKVKGGNRLDPRLVEELSKQLKSMANDRISKIMESIRKPIEVNEDSVKTLKGPLTIDRILDKIIDKGVNSLSETEKKFLDENS
jgi:hypothetical protein